MDEPGAEADLDIDIAEALGATEAPGSQVLTVYVPDKDRDDKEYGEQRKWVLAFAEMLNKIGGGVTVMPPAEGGWFDEENQRAIWERTVLVYTYIKPMSFRDRLPDLRALLHGFGRETRQGEVVVEYDGDFFRIRQYDGPQGE